MFAIVSTGNKQYLVSEGDTFHIDKRVEEVDAKISLDVLLVAEDDGSTFKVGAPTVSGASVSATVVKHGLEKKVHVVKYKPKSRYARNVGHRQQFTEVKIEKITA